MIYTREKCNIENHNEMVDVLREELIRTQTIVVDLRDAILAVLIKHDICVHHWQIDDCPRDIYGKRTNIGGKYEAEVKHLLEQNKALRKRINDMEAK